MNRQEYNPLNDYLFKFIFGRNERKRITLSLLNAILELDNGEELTDIEFIDRDIDPTFEEDKLSKLDIYGIANDQSRIDIEVQLINRKNMEKRTLFYWAKMYQSLKKGEDYKLLHRAITINLLNFDLLPTKEAHSMYGLYNMQNGHRLTKDLEIHFLEIPKTEIKSIKEMKRLDRWLAYFSNKLDEKEMEELAMSEAAIRDALQAESIFMQSDRERRKYEQREKAIRDYESDMKSSREEGLAQGITQGITQGIHKTILGMLKKGLDYALIAEVSGVAIEQIENLARKNHLC